MADDRSRNRNQQSGQNDMTRGESDEQIRGVGEDDTDEFEDTESTDEEAEEDEDEGSF